MIAEAEPLGLELKPNQARDIVRIGEMIKAAAAEQLPVEHPEHPGISGITIAQLSGPAINPKAARRNAVIVSTGKLDWDKPASWTGALDRSPCGTGTSAKMATLYAKGQLPLAPRLCPRRSSGHDIYWEVDCRDACWALCRRGSGNQRASLDHGVRELCYRGG